MIILPTLAFPRRLRQVDVKAEHFERQVQRVEQERDMWEKKYEVRLLCPIGSRSHLSLTIIQEAEERHRKTKTELDELIHSMQDL